MLYSNFKLALRLLIRHKLYAVINIFGLAIGFTCAFIILIWAKDEFSFDGFHTQKDNLHQIIIKHPDNLGGAEDPNSPYALVPALSSEYPEIIAYSRFVELHNVTNCVLAYYPEGGQPLIFYETGVIQADPSFFNMFTFEFAYGEPAKALSGPNSVVISEAIAWKYFGAADPLGQTLVFNNTYSMVVTGVVRVPDNTNLKFNFISPIDENFSQSWNWADPSYIQVSGEVSVDDLKAKIAGSFNRLYPRPLPDEYIVDLLPISKSHLHFGGSRNAYILLLIGLFILLIASINYMNLSTSLAGNRTKEIGIRKVVGANRAQAAFQLVIESLVLSVMALALSLLFMQAVQPLINAITDKQLVFFNVDNISTFLMAVPLMLIVGGISSIYPAVTLSQAVPAAALRGKYYLGYRQPAFRKVLVVLQFTISVALILGTIIIFSQTRYMRKMPLGLNTESIIAIRGNETLFSNFPSYLATLSQNPSVLNVTAGQAYPYNEDLKTSVSWEGIDPDLFSTFRYSICLNNYIETFGMTLVQGRSFSEEREADYRNFVVNEKAVEYMGFEDPVGKSISMWGVTGEIIGIVKDFHHVSLHREILPHIFTIFPGYYGSLRHIFISIAEDDIPGTIEFIGETTESFDPNHPFEYVFLDEDIESIYAAEDRIGRLIGYFAIIAIFISSLGIFGMAIHATERRTKEIGIRKVVGASVPQVVGLLSKEFLMLVVIANVIAWPLTWYAMRRWLENFAYRIDLGLGVFILAGLLALVIALATVSLQTIRAATTDPVEALRYE